MIEETAEKMEAWKRLKDKGFKFDGWNITANDEPAGIIIRANCVPGSLDDLNLLFGDKLENEQ